MHQLSKPVFVAAALLAIATSNAAADRDPNQKERSQIQNHLHSLGYTSWDDIEFDTDRGLWEIDDARTSDGKFYDLKLAPGSLEVVRRRIDD